MSEGRATLVSSPSTFISVFLDGGSSAKANLPAGSVCPEYCLAADRQNGPMPDRAKSSGLCYTSWVAVSPSFTDPHLIDDPGSDGSGPLTVLRVRSEDGGEWRGFVGWSGEWGRGLVCWRSQS